MSTTLTHSLFVADRSDSALTRGFKRFVNAMVAARAAAAEREIRRYQALIDDTTAVHGGFRKVGLVQSETLPFNG